MDFDKLPSEITMTIPWNGEKKKLAVEYKHYCTGNVCIQLYEAECEDEGMPWATATVNLPDKLWPGELAIKDYSENEGILDALVAGGVVEEPHRYVSSGHVIIPVCKLKNQD